MSDPPFRAARQLPSGGVRRDGDVHGVRGDLVLPVDVLGRGDGVLPDIEVAHFSFPVTALIHLGSVDRASLSSTVMLAPGSPTPEPGTTDSVLWNG